MTVNRWILVMQRTFYNLDQNLIVCHNPSILGLVEVCTGQAGRVSSDCCWALDTDTCRLKRSAFCRSTKKRSRCLFVSSIGHVTCGTSFESGKSFTRPPTHMLKNHVVHKGVHRICQNGGNVCVISCLAAHKYWHVARYTFVRSRPKQLNRQCPWTEVDPYYWPIHGVLWYLIKHGWNMQVHSQN